MVDAPIPPAEDPVLVVVRARLGQSIRIKPATPYYQMLVIVCLSRAFELCDLEGHQFNWYLNLLRVFLMCLREWFRLRYQWLF